MKPRKKKLGRPTKVGPNPYLPSLISMGQHWTPEQIAGVISEIEIEARQGTVTDISERLVLKLAKLPQKPSDTRSLPSPIDEGEQEPPLGPCSRCYRHADLVAELPSGKVERLCQSCYDKLCRQASGEGKEEVNVEDSGDGDGGSEEPAG